MKNGKQPANYGEDRKKAYGGLPPSKPIIDPLPPPKKMWRYCIKSNKIVKNL